MAVEVEGGGGKLIVGGADLRFLYGASSVGFRHN